MDRDAQRGATTICLLLAEHDRELYDRCLKQLPPNERTALVRYLGRVSQAILASLGLLPRDGQD